MSVELSIDELFNVVTDAAAVAEANRPETVATGGYVFQAVKAEPRVDDRESFDSGPNPNYERKSVHVWGALSKDGQRAGKIGFDASWEKRINPKNGRPDKMFLRWVQLIKALDLEKASVGEVIQAVTQYPLYLFITESYKAEDGSWINPKTAEERVEAIKSGGVGYNFVQTVGAVR
jgi:hypothetical protein